VLRYVINIQKVHSLEVVIYISMNKSLRITDLNADRTRRPYLTMLRAAKLRTHGYIPGKGQAVFSSPNDQPALEETGRYIS
jgi:hypothetical protein